MRSAFFFPHPRKPTDRPGRVPFHVRAPLLSAHGCTVGEAVVCADGYADDTIGTNQDPCVFSAPAGPFLSFCRINRKDAKNYIRGTKKLLSHSISEGDVIVFGKYEPGDEHGPTERVWVDTVLVVAQRPPQWPTSQRTVGGPCNSHRHQGKPACGQKKWALKDPRGFAARITGAPDGAQTDAYRYNLSDAERGGMHCCTNLDEYRVIVGARSNESEALDPLSTSFVSLAQRSPDGRSWWPAWVTGDHFEPEAWEAIRRFVDEQVRPPPRGYELSGTIAQFDSFDTAMHLCRKIVQVSGSDQGRPGTVAVPPLTPLTLKRHDPRTATTMPVSDA
ncbi:hypothetical protein WMF38_12565 [Sorangium sp. So ce118]